MSSAFADFLYLLAAVCFILALKGLSHPATSRRGNIFGMAGMALAVGTTVVVLPIALSWVIPAIGAMAAGAGVGALIARRVAMTALPQLVAAFHSLVGLAAVVVAISAYYHPASFGIGVRGSIAVLSLFELCLGSAIGAFTFTASVIAFLKLQGTMSGRAITFTGQHVVNFFLILAVLVVLLLALSGQHDFSFWLILALALLLGVLAIIPIGGADMPVVISMLNSYSGWAACGIGLTLHNNLLIIAGALVGSSGAILSYIMCRGMNRSFWSVILGGFGADSQADTQEVDPDRQHRKGSAEDAAFMLAGADEVFIVPGYGLAVAQAQHALREVGDLLKAAGVAVRYAIHPVAGRMPGHMNVLLAEANVPYDEVFEMEEVNKDFSRCDVALVVGANDVTNPSAKTDSGSPIYGMPILEVERAQDVLFVKRTMSSGYAGVDNPLFYMAKTTMLLEDAKTMCEGIARELKNLSAR